MMLGSGIVVEREKGVRHGTEYAYRQGCKCDLCRCAANEARKLRKRREKTDRTRCVICGKVKKIPDTKILPRIAYEQDPYCSRVCAERGHMREKEEA